MSLKPLIIPAKSAFLSALSVLFVVSAFVPALAQSGTDNVFRFLNLPPSARIAGLSANVIALPDGKSSEFQVNPAYLNSESHERIAVSYTNHLSDINVGTASGAYHIEGIGTAGVGIQYIGYGDFTRTNESGQDIGSFNAYDLAVNLGLGREVVENLQIGASLNLIYSSLDEFNSSGISLSAGALYKMHEGRTTFAATVTNFGSQLSAYDDETQPLPLDIRIGASRLLEHIPLRLILTAHSLHEWPLRIISDNGDPDLGVDIMRHLAFAGELKLSNHLYFRLGNNRLQSDEQKSDSRIDLAGTSFGFGLYLKKIRIDFSRNSYSELGGLTQLSLSTKI